MNFGDTIHTWVSEHEPPVSATSGGNRHIPWFRPFPAPIHIGPGNCESWMGPEGALEKSNGRHKVREDTRSADRRRRERDGTGRGRTLLCASQNPERDARNEIEQQCGDSQGNRWA